MRRISAAVGICIPVAILGCLLAHQAGYFLESPDQTARSLNLSRDGHGYMRDFVFMIPAIATLVMGGFLFALHGSMVSNSPVSISPKPFAFTPAMVFLVQESAERVAIGDALAVLSEWSVIVGLVLQIPFGLIAYLLARLILQAADQVARVISERRARPQPAKAILRLPFRRTKFVFTATKRLIDQAPRRGPPWALSQPAVSS